MQEKELVTIKNRLGILLDRITIINENLNDINSMLFSVTPSKLDSPEVPHKTGLVAEISIMIDNLSVEVDYLENAMQYINTL